MRIDDALGFAGCPRGVTHACGVVFAEQRDLHHRAAGYELFVIFQTWREWLAAQAHDDHPLEFDLVPEFFVKRQQHVVDDQEAVAGVIGDITDVVGMQAQI